LKKDNFLKGTFVATFYIILVKIIGILYVIPFRAIIGSRGGALYTYAYQIYTTFLSFSTVGIPLAISKIVSEYNTLGFYKTQKRVYNIAKRITITLACIVTFSLLIFARLFALGIKGGIKGGNTVEDVTFVVRISALSLIFVAIISNMRGYLQGNRYISVSSGSQVIEQIFRVSFIVLGSFIVKDIFKLSLTWSVGVAVFGATVGAVAAMFFLKSKIKKIDEQICLDINYVTCIKEKEINSKFLVKKLIFTAMPFIIVSMIDNFYGLVNIMTVVKTLVNNCNYSPDEAEAVVGFLDTWGSKLNAIVTAIATGMTMSILPNITKDIVSNNLHAVKRKINKTLQILIYTTVPISTGLSLLSKPVLTAFYGANGLDVSIFSLSIFVAVFASLEMNIGMILQSLNEFKTVYTSVIFGLILNATLNIPLMILFDKLGWGAYNGPTFSSIIGLSTSIIISLISLRRKYKINYTRTLREIIICFIANAAMILSILIFKKILPFDNITNRFFSVFLIIIYALIGGSVYIFITYKSKTIEYIFGKEILNKIKKLNIFKKSK